MCKRISQETFYGPPGSYNFELGDLCTAAAAGGKYFVPPPCSFEPLPIKFRHINIAVHVGLWREIIISKEYKVCENALVLLHWW